jgi:hypothetical protein
MKSRMTLTLVLLLSLTACGDDSGGDTAGRSSDDGTVASDSDSGTAATDSADSGDAGSDSGSGGSGGVVDPQPPGNAIAVVDGQEFAFDLPGGLACQVSEEEFSFSFRIGDNEVVVGGGATRSNGEWFGSVSLQVFADNNVTDYSANVIDNPSAIAIDGNSVSYSGPMEKRAPTEDGSVPEPEDVGNGTISFTCG